MMTDKKEVATSLEEALTELLRCVDPVFVGEAQITSTARRIAAANRWARSVEERLAKPMLSLRSDTQGRIYNPPPAPTAWERAFLAALTGAAHSGRIESYAELVARAAGIADEAADVMEGRRA